MESTMVFSSVLRTTSNFRALPWGSRTNWIRVKPNENLDEINRESIEKSCTEGINRREVDVSGHVGNTGQFTRKEIKHDRSRGTKKASPLKRERFQCRMNSDRYYSKPALIFNNISIKFHNLVRPRSNLSL